MRRPAKAETHVQREIKKALEAAGYLVRRVHSGKARVRGGFLQLAENGTADLLVQGTGFTAWLEVKTDKGEQSPDQKSFEDEVCRRRNIYIVARTPAEALEALSFFASQSEHLSRSEIHG